MNGHLEPPDRVARALPLLVAYFPLGDAQIPLEWLDVYAQNRVDFVEFGWPARDPYLDGPDVRSSMARALTTDVLASLAEAKRRLARFASPPRALLMTYAEARHAGLDHAELLRGLASLLVVGSPEDPIRKTLETQARLAGATISTFLPLPLTEPDIVAAQRASGYAMLQAAAGVTGPRPTLDPANGARIRRLRSSGVTAPIVLGFGVSQGTHARAARDLGAEGVVVGSAALRAASQGRSKLDALLHEIRTGLDD